MRGWADSKFTVITLNTSLLPGLSLTQPHFACPCLPSLTQLQPCTPAWQLIQVLFLSVPQDVSTDVVM